MWSMRLAYELGRPLEEILGMPPHMIARWMAFFKLVRKSNKGKPKPSTL